MIVDLNITEYIRSLMKEEKNDLSKIEVEARVNHVPIVKPETKELLRTLVLLKKPMKILEVGAAVGFSSLYMNSYQPEGGTIITIERNEKRIKKAKDLLEHSDLKTFEISDAVGIHDPAYFSVLFKKYTGMSPKSYRNKADSL